MKKSFLLLFAAWFPACLLHAGVMHDSEPATTTARLDGPLQERMLDMVTDAAGNTYIVGSFSSAEMTLQVFKDTTAGDGSAAEQTAQTRTLRSTGGEDIFVAKYSPTGALLWARSAGGTGNDYGTGVTVDQNGNVFITGSFSGSANIGGTQLTSTLKTVASGQGAVTDAGLNIQSDLFVAMLDSSGVWRWAKKLDWSLRNTVASGTYAAYKRIDFGGDNEPVAAGYTRDGGHAFNGTFGWTTWGNVDQAQDNFQDGTADGTAGGQTTNVDTRTFILMHDPDGDPGQGWRINLPAGAYRFVVRAGNIDDDGNDYQHVLYTTSENPAATGTALNVNPTGAPIMSSSAITFTLSQAGWLWLRPGALENYTSLNSIDIDVQATNAPDISVSGILGLRSGDNAHPGKALKIDGDGNLYLKGRFIDSQNAVKASGTSMGLAFVSATGSSFLIDDDSTYTGARNSFVTKLKIANVTANRADPAQWSWDWLTPFGTGYAGTSANKADNTIIADMAVDSLGDLSVTGSWRGRLTAGGAPVEVTNNSPALANTEGFVVRLRGTDGQRTQLVTMRVTGGTTPANRVVSPEAMCLDADGNAFVAMQLNGRFGSANVGDTFSLLSATSAPAITVTSAAATDFIVAKLDRTGEWKWKSQPGGSGGRLVRDIKQDASGNLFVTGALSGTASFGGTTLNVSASGSVEPFIAKLAQQISGAATWTLASSETSAPVLELNSAAWTVVGVHSGSAINSLAAADSALLSAPTFTGTLVPFINYGDGSQGLFATDVAAPIAGSSNAYKATGTLNVPVAGTYTFGINTDDGGRLRIDGTDVILDGTPHGAQTTTGSMTLTAGTHAVEFVFFQQSGGFGAECFQYVDGTPRLLTGSGGLGIAAGSSTSFTAADGVVYTAETGLFAGGSTQSTATAINGTTDDALYQKERYGTNFTYTKSQLAPGEYRVTLKWSENFDNAAGTRIFDVKMQNQTVLDDFDIFAAAGAKFTAVDRTFDVLVKSDGVLSIQFIGNQGGADVNAKINGIRIEAQTTQNRFHGVEMALAPNGTLWWLVSSGRDSSLDRDLNGTGVSAGELGASNFLGTRTGVNRAFDETNYYGGFMVGVDLSLLNRVFNETGYYAGQEIPPPADVYRDGNNKPLQPEVEVNGQLVSDSTKFFWDSYSAKLYAVSPVISADVKWRVSASLINSKRIVDNVATRWPSEGEPHQDAITGGGAAENEPAIDLSYGDGSHRFAALLYTEAGGTISGSSLVAGNNGWSSLLFVDGTAAPGQAPARIVAVHHLKWRDVVTDSTPAVIGTALSDPRHQDPQKNGFVLNAASRFDGTVQGAAHNRLQRTGPIIPVNRDEPGLDDDMVVAWYQKNTLSGVYFPSIAVRYDCQWPTSPEKIVITSSQGSDPVIHGGSGDVFPQTQLLSSKYQNASIYHQPDKSKAGYNPNEEHALLLTSQTRDGLAVFALRNDLNHLLTSTSDPYVLMKYQDATDGLAWKMKVYRVDLTGTYTVGADSVTFDFSTFSGTAGKQVQPPYPLGIQALGDRPETNGSGTPFYRDHKSGIWARSAGTMSVGYYYTLQPDFWYDRDGNGAPDNVAAVPWLEFVTPAQAPGNATATLGDPININYQIAWPAFVPTLQVGDTLTHAKNNLPDIRNWAAAAIAFDENQPGFRSSDAAQAATANPLLLSARLFDALSERRVPYTAAPQGITLPDAGGLKTIELEQSTAGRYAIKGLPPHLKSRVRFDPNAFNNTGGLIFAGLEENDPTGASPVLINVMTKRERDAMLALDDGDTQTTSNSQWDVAVRALYLLTRNPNGIDMDRNGTTDDSLLYGLLPPVTHTGTGPVLPSELRAETQKSGISLTAGLGSGTGYMTLVQNDDDALGAAPVDMSVIQITNPPVTGNIYVINASNVFDEAVTLRHSADFGGNPDALTFEWYYQEDADGLPPGTLPPGNGWQLLNPSDQLGANDLVIKGSGSKALADGWVFVRYKGYGAGGWSTSQFGTFGGDRSATTTPLPAHTSGWIKRVTQGINAFDARTSSFADSPTQTYASMLQQAGRPYQGDVAFNGDPSNVNSIGLLELYTTVLRRGLSLSVNGTPPQAASPAVSNALLLAASRISDFYMLLGNEAYADAQDPTVGFTDTSGGQFGTLAGSVFAFQNQLPSLIDEELALLRGRDDHSSGVGAFPVFNRLFWNFTNGLEGEPAYVSNYNITDQNFDGHIDEKDAAILFPMGHGDAWGHYLSATKSYYQLMRHPLFTWIPRTEAVTVAGVAIQVDYLDERKFAAAASAKARAGKEIVDLVYRDAYTADPSGQWQGYKDTNAARGWGMDEWARRAGQSALLDWAAANAILPETSTKEGLARIDRSTVTELLDIAAQFTQIEQKMDDADRGLNPLGVTGETIPFDIEPTQVTPPFGGEPLTHFEQIYQRALDTINNARGVYGYANLSTQRLRQGQLDADKFADQVEEEERDYKNRLIEIYGYPYEGDAGAGKTYPSGYDGPDLYHWMYVDVAEFSEQALPQATPLDGKQVDIATAWDAFKFPAELDGSGGTTNVHELISAFFPQDVADTADLGSVGEKTKAIHFPYLKRDARGPGQWAFAATTAMGSRRAPGKLQQAIGDMVQKQVELEKAVSGYNDYLDEVKDELELLQSHYHVATETMHIRHAATGKIENINQVLTGLRSAVVAADATAEVGEVVVEGLTDGISKEETLFGGDVMAAARGIVRSVGGVAFGVLKTVSATLEEAAISQEQAKETIELETDLEIEDLNLKAEIEEHVKAVEQKLREESDHRLEVFQRQQDMAASIGEFQRVLAEGQRLLEERLIRRQKMGAAVQQLRYQDMTFRTFRNDALQKYRAAFDLAARYAFLAAKTYDYETCLPASNGGVGATFLTSIVRQRALGQFINDLPVNGVNGLSDPLARMKQNFTILKGQLGFNNPQTETGRFSLRTEMMRILPDSDSDQRWREALQSYRVADLWSVREFRRLCRPFAPESSGAQPGLVIPFRTDITFGQNFFGWPLAGGDSSYDSSNFATKVRSVGVWFDNYNISGLSNTPRVYLVPAGMDILRTPIGSSLATREFDVVDQQLPVPFQLGNDNLSDPAWIPQIGSLNGNLYDLRRYNRFRAYHDAGFDVSQMTTDSRAIGRSVWNTQWMLIIPGGTFLSDGNTGLDTFINGKLVPGSTTQRDGNGIKDIKLFFQTYAYPGL